MNDLDLENIIPHLIGVWRRLIKERGPADVLQTREFRGVVEAVRELTDGLELSNTLVGKEYFSDPKLLGGYILYQWVLHYQQGMALISELPNTPRRVLDVCSGPSPFAFAALKSGCGEVIATDYNRAALDIGAEICGRYGYPLSIRHWDCLKDPCPVEGKFDLIIVGHGLQELQNHERFLKHLLGRLTPNGFLMIVDSSYEDANHRILALRDHFVKAGVPVQAPCVWRGECPALKAKSLCFAQREFEKPYMIKEIQRAAKINLSSLKMSYLILRSPQAAWPELPAKPLYRVISPPAESQQGKRFYLCGTDEKKSISCLGEPPRDARAFSFLRRGELISIEKARGANHLEIVDGTKVVIEAACNKPLPYFNI